MIAQWIAPQYLDPKKLRAQYTKAKPFPHLSLEHFLVEERAEAIRRAILSEEFFEKESDLFKLSQTNEFKHTRNPVLQEFREFLASKAFSDYLKTATGFLLKNNDLDMAGFKYMDTDFLLCHDDRVTGRKIAYIFYFNDDFTPRDGGALALFADKKGHPGAVVRRYSPAWNTFNFFTVSTKSWHSVEEVTGTKPRLSIGGWFH